MGICVGVALGILGCCMCPKPDWLTLDNFCCCFCSAWENRRLEAIKKREETELAERNHYKSDKIREIAMRKHLSENTGLPDSFCKGWIVAADEEHPIDSNDNGIFSENSCIIM